MIAAIALCLGALAAWRETYALHCAALVVPAFVYLMIVLGLREGGVLRRRFFAEFYFRDGSWLRAFFSRTLLVTILALFAAVIPAAALCLDLTTWTSYELAVVAADAVVLVLLLRMFDGMTRGAARPEVRAVLVKRWAVAVNVVLLVTGLIAARLMTPPPVYALPTLSATMAEASQVLSSACPWIDAALQLQIGKEALGWWLILSTEARLGAGDDAGFIRWLAWAIFLISGSLSAYAYGTFLAQLAYAADHLEDDA